MQQLNGRTLTKSLFVKAIECPTKIYYASNPGYVDISKENQFCKSLQEGGFQVEELARLYHYGGINLKEFNKQDAIDQTTDLIREESNVIIYEASIAYENCFIRIDILVKTGNNLELFEVKTKSIDSTKDTFLTLKGFVRSEWKKYLYDVAFQAFILSKAFPQYKITPYLMLVDTSKRTSVEGLNQLIKINRNEEDRIVITHTIPNLTKEDLGDEILDEIPVEEFVNKIWEGTDIKESKKSVEEKKDFEQRIQEYSNYCKNNEKYTVTIGSKCKRCEYRVLSNSLKTNEKSGFEECWKEVLKWGDAQFRIPHIFDLWKFRKTQKLIDEGVYFLKDIDAEKYGLKERQKLQIDQTINNPEFTEFINRELFEELEEFNFPWYLIDFETTRVALPFNKGRKPYEIIAYQFSIHKLDSDKTVTHSAEWINTEQGVFPNFEFIRQLRRNLPEDGGTIFQYSDYEAKVLKEIYSQLDHEKESIPDAHELMEWIQNLTESKNLVDMLEIVQSNYYHPLMKGSNSIKEVLMAVINNSELLIQKYSNPYFGTNFPDGIIWIQKDEDLDQYKNPYKLLVPIGENNFKIREGGAAMTAYGKIQYTDIAEDEMQAIIEALLRYCELDTLAMAMILEHWLSLKEDS